MIFKMIATQDKKDELPALTKMLKDLKSYTALKANKILNRTGSFWQAESFDRVIRDSDELENTIRYVLNNPVKASLVKKWQDWAYSYSKDEFSDTFRNL